MDANAARAVLGADFRLMEQRGRWRVMADDARALATVHPSWVWRQSEADARERAMAVLKGDLALLAQVLAPE